VTDANKGVLRAVAADMAKASTEMIKYHASLTKAGSDLGSASA